MLILDEELSLKRYSVELYFYKDPNEFKGYKTEPTLDEYSSETVTSDVFAHDWVSAEKKLLSERKDIAYIHVVDISEQY